MGQSTSKIPPTCMLHIGKTGGSYMRSILKYNEARWTQPIELLGHSATIASSAKRFGPSRKLAFVIRNPLDRFSSAFYSRQRQGRPTYQSQWTADEAAAFLWFESAEQLALWLGSKNEREQSAARFAMVAIQHLRADFRHHLGGIETLQRERDNILACVDLSNLDSSLPKIMTTLGIPDFTLPKSPRRHEAPTPLPRISRQAKAALQHFWADEFELYHAASDLAEALGFTG